jgi:hypothetical protein
MLSFEYHKSQTLIISVWLFNIFDSIGFNNIAFVNIEQHVVIMSQRNPYNKRLKL